MEPIEEERLGAPYYRCPLCPFALHNRESVVAHMRDHEPHPTLDEILNPPVKEEARQTVGVEPTSPGASPGAPIPSLAAPEQKE